MRTVIWFAAIVIARSLNESGYQAWKRDAGEAGIMALFLLFVVWDLWEVYRKIKGLP